MILTPLFDVELTPTGVEYSFSLYPSATANTLHVPEFTEREYCPLESVCALAKPPPSLSALTNALVAGDPFIVIVPDMVKDDFFKTRSKLVGVEVELSSVVNGLPT